MTNDPLTCDDAFDALTDPTRRDDDSLRQHLADCARCRQMQDVLQPAIALFAPPAESTEAPGFGEESPFGGSNLNADAADDAELAARELRRRSPLRSPSTGGSSAWLGTAVAAALFVALAAAGISMLSGGGSQAPSAGAAQVTCLWQNRGAPVTTNSGRGVSSRQVVLSCVACHVNSVE